MKSPTYCRQVSFILSILLFFQPLAWATEGGVSYGLEDFRKPLPTAQYIYSSSGKSNLVAVELLGSVAKPGIYYIPENTDLLKLLTLAGGVSSNANTERVLVRKKHPESWKTLQDGNVHLRGASYSVDLDSVISSGASTSFGLAADDFVYVPRSEPMISEDVFRSASVLSLLVGSILTAVIISDRARSN